MKSTMRNLARDRSDREVRPEQLALIYIERLFTAFCLGYGSMIALVPHDRIPPNAVSEVALSAGLSPSGALSLMYLIPGLLLIWSPTRTVGLWMAVFGGGVFEVGLVASALHGSGTATGPVAMVFHVAVAAVLLSLHREARRMAHRQVGSNSPGRSSDGTSR